MDYYDDILKCEPGKPPYLADQESFDSHVEAAKSCGMEVRVATDYELFLDYDFKMTGTLSSMMEHGGGLLQVVIDNNVNVVNQEFTRSSGGNIHGIITLDTPFDEASRLAMEVALGSDPKRGILGVLRLKNGINGVSRLFRPLPLEMVVL